MEVAAKLGSALLLAPLLHLSFPLLPELGWDSLLSPSVPDCLLVSPVRSIPPSRIQKCQEKSLAKKSCSFRKELRQTLCADFGFYILCVICLLGVCVNWVFSHYKGRKHLLYI